MEVTRLVRAMQECRRLTEREEFLEPPAQLPRDLAGKRDCQDATSLSKVLSCLPTCRETKLRLEYGPGCGRYVLRIIFC